LVVLACSGGGSGNVSSGGGTPDSFTQEFCGFYQPCCAQAGLRTDGTQCRALITLSASQGQYDAQAGSQCLSEMRAASSKPDFCQTGASPTSCSRVYRASNSGNRAPGETCSEDDDCATSTEGKVDCAYIYVNNATKRICQLQVDGHSGDSPCVSTRNGNTTIGSGQSDVPRGYICDIKDGIYCDSTSKACKPLANVGEPCTSTESCIANAYCDFATATTHNCAARLAVGADCSKNGSACEANAYCDSTSHQCAAKTGAGGDCTTSTACASSSCVNGKCQGSSSSSSLKIICGNP
jgi:hypothetical protein